MVNGIIVSKPLKKVDEVEVAEAKTTKEAQVWKLTPQGPVLESKACFSSRYQQDKSHSRFYKFKWKNLRKIKGYKSIYYERYLQNDVGLLDRRKHFFYSNPARKASYAIRDQG